MQNISSFDAFSQNLSESVNDRHPFKAVFMVGGPGAGKSFVARKMFHGENVKIINSDHILEFLMRRANMPLEFRKDSDIYQAQMDIRQKAKTINDRRMANVIDGMLSIVIDGTGKSLEKCKRQKDALEAIGYDCHMVFVDTPLHVSLERNAKRERKVDPDLVKQYWEQVHGNKDGFNTLFGHRFHTVSGNEPEALLTRLARRMLLEPLSNPVGTSKVAQLKDSGKGYLSQLDNAGA